MKKAIILMGYTILLIVTLIECVNLFDIYGLLVYFILGLLYALPIKLYENYKEKKENAARAKINANKPIVRYKADMWDILPNYAM